MIRYAVIALIIGVPVSLFISFDPFISNYLDARDAGSIFRIIPYSLPFIFLLICLGFLLVFQNVERIWRKRISIFFTLYIVSFECVSISRVVGTIDLNDLIVLSFLFVWLIDHFINQKETLVRSPLNPLVLVFLIFVILSCVNGGGESMVRIFTTVMKYLVVFFLLLNLLNTKARIRFFMKVFLIVTSFSAIIALSQVLLYAITGKMYIGNVAPITASLIIEETSFGKLLRAPAFFGTPQNFAIALCVTLAVSLYYLVSPVLRGFKERVLLLMAILMMPIALIITFTRAAWLGFAVSALLIPYARRVSYAIHYTAVILLIVVIFHLAGVWGYLQKEVKQEIRQGDIQYRVGLLKSGMEGFTGRHPYIGIGLDQGHKYRPNPYHWPVHNAFAMAAVETGIFGFLVYCSFFVLLATRLIYLISTLRDEKEKTLPKAILVGFVALLIYIQGDPSLHDSLNWIYFALIESTVLVYRREGPVQSLKP